MSPQTHFVAMLFGWLLLLVSQSAIAAGDLPGNQGRSAQVTVTLEAEPSGVAAGSTLWLGLRFELIPRWHVYWRNPGDSGEPPRVTWDLPAGWQAGGIQWPVPQRIPVGPLVNYGYEDTVTFLVPVTIPTDYVAPPDGARVGADLTWLVCKETCIPQDARLTLSIPGAAAAESTRAGRHFEPTRATLPVKLPGSARYTSGPAGLTLSITDSALRFAQADDIWFAADDWGPVSPSSTQAWRNDDSGLHLDLPAGEAPLAAGNPLQGLLVVTENASGQSLTRGFAVTATPQAAVETTGQAVTLLTALGLAFLGGLLLNLMPCVLPVLSIKALGLVQHAAQGRAHGLRHGLAFGAGVLLTFVGLAGLLIALRTGGAAIGWGFQLQEPAVVVALMLLMLALALNLSGVFTLGQGLAGIGQSLTERSGLRGTFATGVLAVVVASPCTAPFMGTALGFALTRPAVETLLVFVGLAGGFALPLVLLSMRPGWARLLPAPGAWMERLRNALAFPLYATAAWLLWVLTQQVDASQLAAALAGSVLFAFGLWWLGQPLRQRRVQGLVVAVLLVGSLGFVTLASRSGPNDAAADRIDRWTPEQVAALRAEGRSVLVNFTAAWCITCKVNEQVALDTPAVRRALADNRIAYLKGDWTRRDAAITRELQRHGRSGVPLYLLYPGGPGDPHVLPQILTEGLVLQAIATTIKSNQGA